MINKKISCAILTCLILAGCTEQKQETGPAVDAKEYIKKFEIGKNFSLLSQKVAKTTQTYMMIASIIGKQKTDSLVSKELNISVSNHQAEWDYNLANSYLEYLSLSEINSLYYNSTNSPYFTKQRSMQSKISTSMQIKSKKLLAKTVTEALTNAYKSVQ